MSRSLPRLRRRSLEGHVAAFAHLGACRAAIGAATQELHLPTVRAEAARLAEIAVRERQTHLGFLAEVLAAEVDDRVERRRVRYVTTAQLVNELVEAVDDRQLSRVVVRYGWLDLLLLEELGYGKIDPRGAELLFQIHHRTRGTCQHRAGKQPALQGSTS